jgi:hypothetical protein
VGQQLTGYKDVRYIEENREVPKGKNQDGMWRIYMLYGRRGEIL